MEYTSVEKGKYMKILIVFPAIFIFTSMVYPQYLPKINCDSAETQEELNICAKQKFDSSDAELNRIYVKILAKIRDEQKEAKDDGYGEVLKQFQESERSLIDAEKKWLSFRVVYSKVYAEIYKGGSMAPMKTYDCARELTEHRIEELKKLLEEFHE